MQAGEVVSYWPLLQRGWGLEIEQFCYSNTGCWCHTWNIEIMKGDRQALSHSGGTWVIDKKKQTLHEEFLFFQDKSRTAVEAD